MVSIDADSQRALSAASSLPPLPPHSPVTPMMNGFLCSSFACPSHAGFAVIAFRMSSGSTAAGVCGVWVCGAAAGTATGAQRARDGAAATMHTAVAAHDAIAVILNARRACARNRGSIATDEKTDRQRDGGLTERRLTEREKQANQRCGQSHHRTDQQMNKMK